MTLKFNKLQTCDQNNLKRNVGQNRLEWPKRAGLQKWHPNSKKLQN